MKTNKVKQAYRFCQKLVNSHYENFPVASVLLPKNLRLPISVIYAFARTADDFADEGSAPISIRLQQLAGYHQALTEISAGTYQGDHPIFIALSDVINRHNLPIYLLKDLLSAFRQDVLKNRYANFNEVLDYCQRSANPVGRLVLYLNGISDGQQLAQSDAICTALQLINFYQDIVQDYTEQNRIYIPQDELTKLGLTESALVAEDTTSIAPVIRSLYQRTERMMAQGYLLGYELSGRMGFEVRAMTLGGIWTLSLLKQQADSALLSRPRLSKWRLIKISIICLSKNCYLKKAQRLLKVAC